MLSYLQRFIKPTTGIVYSKLFSEKDFYSVFIKDLSNCGSEVIIESPFITMKRVSVLLPTLEKLKARHVRVVINTKSPYENDNILQYEALQAITLLQKIGVHVIYTDNHHRKIAILDRNILYEGSLNILSCNNSREVMRRIDSIELAWQMVHFTKLDMLMN
jgi:phosphatidylserine/phosphatidylglycerophosphate/cardiolipin synthase-like enzyme